MALRRYAFYVKRRLDHRRVVEVFTGSQMMHVLAF